MSESLPFLPTAAALMPLPEASEALPVGTQLGEFEIREVIGVGGFGIVYRAWEAALEREVALKEYMPMGLVGRGSHGHVALRSRAHEEDFTLGLRSFVNEARLLARFDHPALVKVHRFWEANGTAYMAMPFYKAQTLRQRRQDIGSQPPTQAWLLSMIEPLLGALAEMHRADVYHRDIAPDNILWCADNRPVLLDFGAARHVLADRTQTLTAILKPQFSPIEQYADARSMRQGPWTDVFALASTCYFMLTGRPPVPATARVLSDELTPLTQLAPPGFSAQVLATLDWAMAVRPQDRPQSVAELWEALHGHRKVPPRVVGEVLPRERDTGAPTRFEQTIQTDARGPAEWHSRLGVEVPSPAALGVATAAAVRTGGASLRSLARGVRPNRWMLLGLVVLSAGAFAWLASRHHAPTLAPVAAAASSPAAIPVVVAVAPPVAAPPPAAASDPAASAAEAKPVHPEVVSRAREARHAKELQADVAWAAAHEASSAASPEPAAHHADPRAACQKDDPENVNACVKRLCSSESRYRKSDACARPEQAPASPWWRVFKSG